MSSSQISMYRTTRAALAILALGWTFLTIVLSIFSDDVKEVFQNMFLDTNWPDTKYLIAFSVAIASILILLFWVFRQFEQLANLKIRNSELSRQLDTDNRSGLSSYEFLRAKFQDDYKPEVERGIKFSVLMIDIIDFKAINDNEGHDVGDEVISMIGGFLKSFVRDRYDLAARYGEAADEFFFIIAGDISALKGFTNRLRSALCDEGFSGLTSVGSKDRKIEIWSSGTTVNQGENWDVILKRLTQGLIKAKSNNIRELMVVGTTDHT